MQRTAPHKQPGNGAQDVGPTRGPGGGGPRLTILSDPQDEVVGVGSRQGHSRRTMSPHTQARISPFQLSATAEAKRVLDSHDSGGEDEGAAPSKGPEAPHRTKRTQCAHTQMRIWERAHTHKRAHTHTHTHTFTHTHTHTHTHRSYPADTRRSEAGAQNEGRSAQAMDVCSPERGSGCTSSGQSQQEQPGRATTGVAAASLRECQKHADIAPCQCQVLTCCWASRSFPSHNCSLLPAQTRCRRI